MPTGGTALLVGPYALAKIMVNKKASKWLTTGMKLPKGSAQLTAIMGRLSDFLNMDKEKPAEMPF